MGRKLFFIIFLLAPAFAQATGSCEAFLKSFNYPFQFSERALRARVNMYLREPPEDAIVDLTELANEVSLEIVRVNNHWRFAKQIYRREFTLWERLNPLERTRRPSERQFWRMRLYWNMLVNQHSEMLSAISKLRGDPDGPSSSTPNWGDSSTLRGPAALSGPFGATSDFSGGFSGGSFSGGSF